MSKTPFLLVLAWLCLRGGSRGDWLASLVLVSAIFGRGHEGQRLTGMLQEGFAGLLLGILYLATRHNLAVPALADAVLEHPRLRPDLPRSVSGV